MYKNKLIFNSIKKYKKMNNPQIDIINFKVDDELVNWNNSLQESIKQSIINIDSVNNSSNRNEKSINPTSLTIMYYEKLKEEINQLK